MSVPRPVRVVRLAPSAAFVSAASYESSFMRHQAAVFATRVADSRGWIGHVLGAGHMAGDGHVPGARLPPAEQAARFSAATSGVDFLFPGYDLTQALPLLAELRNRSRSRVRLLIRAHSPALCPLEWALLGPLLVPGDVILCPSRSSKDLLCYLAPGLEPSLVISPAPAGLPSRPRRASAPGRPVRVATLSRVIPGKLLHRLIDGIAHLPAGLRSRAQLCIGGPLTGDDGRPLPYAATLAARAARLGLAASVRLAGAVQGEQAKAQFLGAADVLVNLSVAPEESFGMAVAEGLSAGTPVVVTRWDGLPELAGPAGAVVPVGLNGPMAVCDVEPAAIAAAIESAAGDPALRALCSAQAAKFAPARAAAMLAAALQAALAASDTARAHGPVREDLREYSLGSGRGLLARTAPLPGLGWGHAFCVCSSPGPPGDGLRRQVVEATLPPVTRFMAGLAAPAGDGEADGPATATSELVALWHRAVTGAAPAPEARLQALRQLPGRTATVRFVEVERARAAGEVTRAADLACQGVDELLAASGAEHAVRALHQLASVCVAAGRADEALERLRRWLAMFPDSPGTPAVWLVLAELGAHAAAVPGPPLQRLLGAARDAVTHATRFLADDDPALVRVAGRLVTLTAGARAEAACGVREEPAPGPERCPP